jgi:hypothetical protein
MPIFVALTSDSLLLYDQIPQHIDEWFKPPRTYSLLITRLINFSREEEHRSELNNLFATRHGTVLGTESHLFRTINNNDLKNWISLIENQIFSAVSAIKNVNFGKYFLNL